MFIRAAGFICVFNVASLLIAEGVSVGVNHVQLSGFPEPNLEKSGDAWVEQQHREFTTLMNLQIDMIHRDCNLTDQQIRKLRVAAKGIQERRIEIGLQRLGEFARASGLLPDNADDPAPVRPDKPNEDDGFDAMRIYGAKTMGRDVVLFFTRHTTPITDHPKWQQILQRTLTKEQLNLYREASIQRHRRLLENSVRKWVSELDEQLYLSERQAEKIFQHVNDLLQKEVTASHPNQMTKAIKLVEEKNKSLDATVEAILSAAQIERWKTRHDGRLRPTVSWGG